MTSLEIYSMKRTKKLYDKIQGMYSKIGTTMENKFTNDMETKGRLKKKKGGNQWMKHSPMRGLRRVNVCNLSFKYLKKTLPLYQGLLIDKL